MTKTLLIRNAQLVLPHRVLAPGWIKIRGDTIADLGKEPLADPDPGAEVIDASGRWVVPGFIDVHCHGFLRYSVQEGAEAIRAMSRELPSVGVTTFLPTLMPLAPSKYLPFLKEAADATRDAPGARMPGVHSEGPFLARTGAIPPEGLIGLDMKYLDRLLQAGDGRIAAMSISPDFPDSISLAQRIKRAGGKPFVTHTQATFEQALEFLDAVPDAHATHFYDVFHQPKWEELGTTPVGAVEAFLLSERATVDFIVDGVHVHPALIQLAIKRKGMDHCALCTDANIGAGMPYGEYAMPDGTVIVISEAGGARDQKMHWLAGSALTMNVGLRNLVEMIGLSIVDAARMAATTPAYILGLSDRGSIQRGKLADLVVLGEEWDARRTLIGGKSVWRAAPCDQ